MRIPLDSSPYDVIVVGAGPTGLFLACELAMRDMTVLVLEKDASPHSEWKCGLHGKRGMYGVPLVDAFYRRGMLEEIFQGHKTPSHCTRLEVQKADLSRWKHRLPLSTEFHLPAPMYQNQLEDMLCARLEDLGGQIKRGVEVKSFEQQDDAEETSVTLKTVDREYRCRWLVGCDGEKSNIRTKAGIDFVGTGPQFVNYVAECDLADPESLGEGLKPSANGFYITPSPGTVFAMDFSLDQQDTRSITREQFEQVMRRITGREIVVAKLRSCTATANDLRQAAMYRKGRVLLAGASAHHHPSLGGAQAMTVGLEDAVNLGWKLAYTIRGVAPSTLLDTYERERYPYAKEALELARVQIAANRPTAEGKAIKSIVRQLASSRENTTLLLEQAIGLGRQHNLNGSHPLVGYSAPDVVTDGGRRLGAVLESGKFVLVHFESGECKTEVAELSDKSSVLESVSCLPQANLELGAMLVRPDGIICWATDSSFNIEEASAALAEYIL
ncbi:hypothetical protein PRZ48_013863 [Zasmidium cellare]|uniref:FAD-binding domain-containing protein n=1 Tax=Zasmidium cellare TaxID=395010 RepID=A0ABR0E2T1_ZASCE|nr:hypothetical protein PRZ48_013863 [Zasmidium cellare]